ncbi:carboxymuconolactone decarboxylase family protein [Methylobacterium sp. Leaf117]|uniref:carboxymuconolactone decarboxylase family protein n=1 Tax=Methylobacterium sp. Leaf117 TaxID=1736260 RepID=UPI000A6E5920
MSERLVYQSRSPEGLKALGTVYAYVTRCGLDKTLVDLVYLRASQINGCTYCVDTHATDLLGAGISAQKLLLLPSWREAALWFTAREQAALAWTEAVTEVATSHIPDQDRVRRKGVGRPDHRDWIDQYLQSHRDRLPARPRCAS